MGQAVARWRPATGIAQLLAAHSLGLGHAAREARVEAPVAPPRLTASSNGWHVASGDVRWGGYQVAENPRGLFREVVVAGGGYAAENPVRLTTDDRGEVTLTTASGVPLAIEADGSLTVSGQPGQGTQLGQFRREYLQDRTYALHYEDRYIKVYPDGRVAARKGLSASSSGVLLRMPSHDRRNTSLWWSEDMHTLDDRILGVVKAPIWAPEVGREGPDYAWQTGIITYAGKDVLQYIDGAVMLGLSLQKLVPEFPRVCMVVKSMLTTYKTMLARAGWAVVDVDNWHAKQSLDKPFRGPLARHWDSFAKVNCFRINMRRALWMDADMLLYSDRLRDVLNDNTLPQGFIAMVRDSGRCDTCGRFNSGLMFFEPDHTIFSDIVRSMENAMDSHALAQAAINAVYVGKIKELHSVFNYHKTSPPDSSCSRGLVVGHFTGPEKASTHNRSILEGIKIGRVPDSGVNCSGLYRNYYCRLRRHSASLSFELQMMLNATGPCLAGPTYEAFPTSTSPLRTASSAPATTSSASATTASTLASSTSTTTVTSSTSILSGTSDTSAWASHCIPVVAAFGVCALWALHQQMAEKFPREQEVRQLSSDYQVMHEESQLSVTSGNLEGASVDANAIEATAITSAQAEESCCKETSDDFIL